MGIESFPWHHCLPAPRRFASTEDRAVDSRYAIQGVHVHKYSFLSRSQGSSNKAVSYIFVYLFRLFLCPVQDHFVTMFEKLHKIKKPTITQNSPSLKELLDNAKEFGRCAIILLSVAGCLSLLSYLSSTFLPPCISFVFAALRRKG